MEKQNKRKDSTAGRWTRAQHEKFMEALEKYGRDWVKVQKKVKTRTLLQIRSHAQKVFLNMSEDDIKAFIGSDDESFNNDLNFKGDVEKMQDQEIKTNDQEGQKIQKQKKEKHSIPLPNIQKNINPSPQHQQTKLSQQSKLFVFKSNETSEEQSQQGQKNESIFFQMFKQNQEHFLRGGDFLSLVCKEECSHTQNKPKCSTFLVF